MSVVPWWRHERLVWGLFFLEGVFLGLPIGFFLGWGAMR